MTKSGIRLWDTILIGPLCLHINQYFECLINEKWVLFFSCVSYSQIQLHFMLIVRLLTIGTGFFFVIYFLYVYLLSTSCSPTMDSVLYSSFFRSSDTLLLLAFSIIWKQTAGQIIPYGHLVRMYWLPMI